MSWHCAICNVYCPSDYQKEEHLSGAKHRENTQRKVNVLKRGSNSQVPFCGCKVHAREQVVGKDGPNKGRPFFACASKDCNFFEWADVDNSISRSAVLNSRGPQEVYMMNREVPQDAQASSSSTSSTTMVSSLPESFRGKYLKTKMKFSMDGGNVTMNFAYDSQLIDIIKKFPTRKYNPDSKSWSIPLSEVHNAVTVFSFLGIAVPNAVISAAGRAADPRSQLKIIRQEDSLKLEFEYAADVINAVKQVHPKKRQYFFDKKIWVCTLTSLPELLESLAEVGFEPTPGQFNNLLAEAQRKIKEEEQKLQKIDTDEDIEAWAKIYEENQRKEYERKLVEMAQASDYEKKKDEYRQEFRVQMDKFYESRKKAKKPRPEDCESCGRGDQWIVDGVHTCRFFGHFQCLKCRHWWTSAYAWKGEAQNCRNCNTETHYHKFEQLKRKTDDGEERGPHDSARCGMCKKLKKMGRHGGCNLNHSDF